MNIKLITGTIQYVENTLNEYTNNGWDLNGDTHFFKMNDTIIACQSIIHTTQESK